MERDTRNRLQKSRKPFSNLRRSIGNEGGWKQPSRKPWIFLVFLVIGIVVFLNIREGTIPRFAPRPAVVSITELVADSRSGNIIDVTVLSDHLEAIYLDGSTKSAYVSENFDPLSLVSIKDSESGVLTPRISYAKPDQLATAAFWLIAVIAVIALFVTLVFFQSYYISKVNSSYSRPTLLGRAAASDITSGFGKASPKLLTVDRPTVGLDDVGGHELAKSSLRDIIEFLREPQKFAAMGAILPRGVLLFGPPGTGKTLLAKAVAGEAKVPCFFTAGSEFVESFVGVGAARIRDLFARARLNSPCIVFIDDIDAFARKRADVATSAASVEQNQTLVQLLDELDSFDRYEDFIVIAATNRIDILDPALTRPGRFDRIIEVGLPNEADRAAIFNAQIRGKPISRDVVPALLAKMTPNFSGSDINLLVNEAAILAVNRNKRSIGMGEFEDTIARIAAVFVSSRDNAGQQVQQSRDIT